MTELQKMLSGYDFDINDPELKKLTQKTRKIVHLLNILDPNYFEQQKELLKKLLGFIGNNIRLEAPFFCDFGFNIHIGDNTFIHVNCVFLDNNTITIGKNVLIAPSVHIYTTDYPVHAKKRIISTSNEEKTVVFVKMKANPVIIEDNVWIGGNSTILPGVTIGNNTTIGAGSVVTKNIPPRVLAYGNPCRVVRNL